MITLEYAGEFPGNTSLGNKLIQYAFARSLAKISDRALKCTSIEGFPNTGNVGGTVVSGEPFVVDGHIVNYASLPQDRPWHLKGYFQRYEYFKPFHDEIKFDWLKQSTRVERSYPQHHCIHYRLGDFEKIGYVVPPEWFAENLKLHNEWFDVMIVTDSPTSLAIEKLKKEIAHLVPGNMHVFNSKSDLHDFQYIQKFGYIHLSQSTFSWMAAYLSKAIKIYFPLTKVGYWSPERPDIDLRVDEPRYCYRDVL